MNRHNVVLRPTHATVTPVCDWRLSPVADRRYASRLLDHPSTNLEIRP